MRSSRPIPLRLLVAQSLRTLAGSGAFWGMLILLSLLVGYSFISAVELFAEASRTALAYPELGSGLDPVEGVFVPTFGAYYLIETLLLPFVVIRLAGREQQTGALKLLLQLPVSPTRLHLAKLAALAIGGLPFAIPAISAMVIWWQAGGFIHWPALATLLLGHVLYSLTIACIAMFAAVVSGSLATAAMISLAVTLGSWVLDFARNSGGWLATLGGISLTAPLRQLESGLLSSTAVATLLLVSLFFFIAASAFLHPGRRLSARLRTIFLLACSTALIAWLIAANPLYWDATENRRHSFSPADTRALKAMQAPLTITIHMSRDDSRVYDFERSVLSKLRRSVPQLRIVHAPMRSAGLFGAPGDDNYGLIEYDYMGRHDESYSTSPLEVLPLIHALAGQKVSPERETAARRGHPLVADAHGSRWWFYIFLPGAFLLSGCCYRRPDLPLLPLRKIRGNRHDH